MDVHAASIVMVSMIDGAKPPPPQTIKPAALLEWVKKQQALAKEVTSGCLSADRQAKPGRRVSGCTGN